MSYPGPIQWYHFQAEPVSVDHLRSPGIDFQTGGIDSMELIPKLLKCLQI
jgi:hypothetical protein